MAVRRLNGTVRSMFSGVFSGFLLEGINDKQKIKGVFKQCIDWVDTLIAEEKYYVECCVIYQTVSRTFLMRRGKK